MFQPRRTNLGPKSSEGSRLLWLAMRERGLTMGKLAESLDTQTGLLTKYLFGDVRPKWEWAEKLRDALGIPMEAWQADPAEPIDITPAVTEAEAGPDTTEAA